MLEVVTVWAPRPQHEKWRGDVYLELLELQRLTCRKFGHRHYVVEDRGTAPLLKALIAGQIAYLERWDGTHPVVLMDMDCLVARNLEAAFDGSFDIGVTTREHPTQPIQNGVIYLAPGARTAALKMLRRTRELTGEWWGSDQEALARALAPVPRLHRVEQRLGARVAFLPTETHNFSAKTGVPKHAPKRFVFHFKGDTKQYAADTARRYFLLPGAE